MRHFFISALDAVVSIFVILGGLGVIGAAVAVALSRNPAMSAAQSPIGIGTMGGGPMSGLMILVGGFVYLIFVGGFLYLGLGIYHNTRRTAEAMEKLANR